MVKQSRKGKVPAIVPKPPVVIDLTGDDDEELAIGQPLGLEHLKKLERETKKKGDGDKSDMFAGAGLRSGNRRKSTACKGPPSPMSFDGSPASNERQVKRRRVAEQFSLTPRADLLGLPQELLSNVCENLDAIWIVNLSQTCQKLRAKLTGPDANIIYFKALPRALWPKKEEYQKESELVRWRNTSPGLRIDTQKATQKNATQPKRTGSPEPEQYLAEPKTPPRRSGLKRRRTEMEAPSTPPRTTDFADPASPTTYNIERVPMSPYVPVNLPDDSGDAMDIDTSENRGNIIDLTTSGVHDNNDEQPDLAVVSPGRAHKRPRLSKPDSEIDVPAKRPEILVTADSSRKKILALGGPYQPIFNYRREILGRMKQGRRCFVCLHLQFFPHKDPVTNEQWGFRWCDGCLVKYTISLSSLESLMKSLQKMAPKFVKELTNNEIKTFANQAYPYETHKRKCLNRGTVRFYRVEVDEFFSKIGLLSTQHACRVRDHERVALALKADGRCSTATLTHRANMRLKLIKCAEKIWEGVDPEGKGRIYTRAAINPQRFQPWRTTFAPTHKLRTFLFPPHLLPDEAKTPGLTWATPLEICDLPWDPCKAMLPSKHVHDSSLSYAAEAMLQKLTERVPNYNRPMKRLGGTNPVWRRAADEYHSARLINRLSSGEGIGNFVPASPRKASKHVHLRKKLDFESLQPFVDPEKVHEPVKIFPVSECVDLETDEVADLSSAMAEAERERKNKISFYTKIAVGACKRCPVTGLLLGEKGMQGLLDHMRLGHARTFWETDEWELVG